MDVFEITQLIAVLDNLDRLKEKGVLSEGERKKAETKVKAELKKLLGIDEEK